MGDFDALFPPCVAVADLVGEIPRRLDPRERQSLGRVCVKRLDDFMRGRDCAHRALAKLGLDCDSLLISPSGAPSWPRGVLGSISHCQGRAIAAVAKITDCAALGVDVEAHRGLDEGALEWFATPREIEWIKRAPSGMFWDAILFSAKESVFKAAASLSGFKLGFRSIEIVFETTRPKFSAHISGTDEWRVFEGIYKVETGIIGTSVFCDNIEI